MRLLQITTHNELAFTKDLIHEKDDIPPYAILSHTWDTDPDHEVSYKDIKKQRAKQKSGYQKILFCAAQAKCDGLDYFWVDTCCIDKTNAAELTESINSMFRWYQQAEKCYVFLSDVSSGRTHQHEPLMPSWRKEFRASKWFTRGWTLQELIGPSIVEFFSSDRQLLGDRHSLRHTVSEITGIPISVLEGKPLSTFSVDERISWAKPRTTSKKEDKAYSLLGLLSTSMSVIYGEGEKAAFERLYSKLERRSAVLKTTLEGLPVAHGAAYDSHVNEHDPLCHPDTRTEVLREIKEWACDPESKSVYWLNGMAGTGKSTISRTLAHSFSRVQTLGATFFFKRGEGDRAGTGKLFTTVANSLVQQIPKMTANVQDVLNKNPTIIQEPMRDQFQKLILRPISKIEPEDSSPQTRIVIIDAIDECEREEDVKVLIDLLCQRETSEHDILFRNQTHQHTKLKFFLTSRPELPVRLGFKAVHGNFQDFILHDVGESVIKNDIAAYIKHELGIIKEQFNRNAREDQLLSAAWPCSSDLETLVEMAIPLFIFAATISRFIADGRVATPAEQLEEVLKYQTKSQESQLDATYLPILHQIVAGLNRRSRERVIERFHLVIGSVITLADPLSASALAELLQLPLSTIDGALETLHSVLYIPDTAQKPVHLLHLSFRDFLVDPERREDAFWVDEKDTHRRLADHCLRVLSTSLKDNLCNVPHDTGVSSMSVAEVSAYLSPELQYACRFWTHHLRESTFSGLGMKTLWDFVSLHLLHWLEALSWMRRFPESEGMIKTLQSLIEPESPTELIEFLEDSLMFVRDAQYASLYPIQIYASALMHISYRSFSRHSNQHRLTTRIDRIFPVREHTAAINSVIFSMDGKQVASATEREVLVWSIDTGKQIGELRAPMGRLTPIVFSPDTKQVALMTILGTLALWSVAAGEQPMTFACHGIEMVTFSPDSKRLALATLNELTIWSATTGQHLATLEKPVDWLTSMAFSLDNKQMALAIYRKAIIVSAESGECVKTLDGHVDKITAVAFSPDGKHVASAADDQVIIWSTETATQLRVLDIERVTTLRFDPTGAHILTNRGSFAVMLQNDDGTSNVSFASQSIHSTTTLWHLSTDGRWITRLGREVLLLPADPVTFLVILGDTMAIGCESGKGWIIQLSHE